MIAVVVMVSMIRDSNVIVLMALVCLVVRREFNRIPGIGFHGAAQGMRHQHDLMSRERKPGSGNKFFHVAKQRWPHETDSAGMVPPYQNRLYHFLGGTHSNLKSVPVSEPDICRKAPCKTRFPSSPSNNDPFFPKKLRDR